MKEYPEGLSLLEGAMLNEMEWYFGVGGSTIKDRLQTIATALGVGLPEGEPSVAIRELYQVYLSYDG